MLAGGTLPDVFTIPFTDGKSLIEQGQLADITDLVNALPYADQFNPNVLATAQDDEGRIYGLPRQAYGIGLQYNRQLFEQAGLDPDTAAHDVGRGPQLRQGRSRTRPARPATSR